MTADSIRSAGFPRFHRRRLGVPRSAIDHLEIRRGRYEYLGLAFGFAVDVTFAAIVWRQASSSTYHPTRAR
jgi:hypothetical protein